MTNIEVRALAKSFGRVRAVDDLSFAAPAGQVTGFLGPNGSGKTTTLRALLGLVAPTSGTATIGGKPYRALQSPLRTVGAVLDGGGQHPGRRGRIHLRLLAQAAGLPSHRVEEVLQLVELAGSADRRAGGYSLGMRQRLALAGALLGEPEVLVLDEPTNGLDPAGVRWLRDLLRQLAGQGRTVLISSHLLAEVAQVADRVVIISGGRMRYEGPLTGLTADGRSLEDAFLSMVGPEQATAVGAVQ
jgi:ABC-2 type transport system ATP-binding protein